MLFNSYLFVFVFLPFTAIIYYIISQLNLIRFAKIWLISASIFFYSYWNIKYLLLLMISIFVNYILSQIITLTTNKKIFLFIGLIFNIGLLVYFKYMDFFIVNINFIFSTNISLLHLVLPLAISFFTLQQIAFLIDTYEGLVSEKIFFNYTLFVVFFPQLIAGPIVHHKEMIPQFGRDDNKKINFNNIASGLFIFSIGLFKKVVIADTFAIWANNGFSTESVLNFFEAWITSLSYTMQLYFDFSGYSDMAIGIALLFNIKLPINFNSPFKATGIIEFWSKWHITLTNFITTYIYTPIVKSFKPLTFNKAMLATLVTFLIAGLWHGSSWMFVIFGAIHGFALVVNHIAKRKKVIINRYIAWLMTFNTINIANVFFRANDFDNAINIIKAMFNVENIVLPYFLHTYLDNYLGALVSFGNLTLHVKNGLWPLLFISCGFIIILFFKNSSEKLYEFSFSIKNSLYFSILLTISFLLMQRKTEFIYFNF